MMANRQGRQARRDVATQISIAERTHLPRAGNRRTRRSWGAPFLQSDFVRTLLTGLTERIGPDCDLLGWLSGRTGGHQAENAKPILFYPDTTILDHCHSNRIYDQMSDFDPAKEAKNVAKHRVSLARWVDLTVLAVTRDDRFDYGEPRYRAYGLLDGLS